MPDAHSEHIAEFFRDFSDADKNALLSNDEIARLAAQILSATEFRRTFFVVKHNAASRTDIQDYARIYLQARRQMGRMGHVIAVLFLNKAVRDIRDGAQQRISRLRARLLSAIIGSVAGISSGAINLGLRPFFSEMSQLVTVGACLAIILVLGISAVRFQSEADNNQPRSRRLQSIASELESIAREIANGVHDSRRVASRLTEIGRTSEHIPFELLELVQGHRIQRSIRRIAGTDQPLVIGPLIVPYSHSDARFNSN